MTPEQAEGRKRLYEIKLRTALAECRYQSSIPGMGERHFQDHHIVAILNCIRPIVSELIDPPARDE